MSDAPEFAVLGKSWSGKPLLRQTGPGQRYPYHLRFVDVYAASENAAKRIQVAFRKAQA